MSKSYNNGANFFKVLKNTFTPIAMLDEITAQTLLSSIFLTLVAICSSVNPVVPTTTFTPQAVAILIVSTAAGAIVKSTNTSAPDAFKVSSNFSEPTISTPSSSIPA